MPISRWTPGIRCSASLYAWSYCDWAQALLSDLLLTSFSLAVGACSWFAVPHLPTLFLSVCFERAVLCLAMKCLASCSSTPPQKAAEGHSVHVLSWLWDCFSAPPQCMNSRSYSRSCSPATCPHSPPSPPCFSSQRGALPYRTLDLANPIPWWYQIHCLWLLLPTEFNISDVAWWIFFSLS